MVNADYTTVYSTDKLYWEGNINPETGEKFPPGNGWMIDTQYADILKKFLGKYVIDIMNDVKNTVGTTAQNSVAVVKAATNDVIQFQIYKNPIFIND